MAKSSALAGKNVIITGEIEGHKRAAANKILEDAGAKIEKSLNKKVNLVVLGNDPGPDKLKKIEDLGIATRSWDEVIADIEVGGDTTASETEDDEAEKIVSTISLQRFASFHFSNCSSHHIIIEELQKGTGPC